MSRNTLHPTKTLGQLYMIEHNTISINVKFVDQGLKDKKRGLVSYSWEGLLQRTFEKRYS